MIFTATNFDQISERSFEDIIPRFVDKLLLHLSTSFILCAGLYMCKALGMPLLAKGVTIYTFIYLIYLACDLFSILFYENKPYHSSLGKTLLYLLLFLMSVYCVFFSAPLFGFHCIPFIYGYIATIACYILLSWNMHI